MTSPNERRDKGDMSPNCPVLSPANGGSERGQKGHVPLGMSPCPFLSLPKSGVLLVIPAVTVSGVRWVLPRLLGCGGRGAPAYAPPQEKSKFPNSVFPW